MRRLILKMSVSVDGFVGGRDGELDWIFKSMDEGATAWTVETLWQAGVHIMGSRTFLEMAAYWPSSDEPFAAPMNEIPKVVFSRKRLAKPAHAATWSDARVAGGDLAEEIVRLKREPGKDLLAHGGAGFVQNLGATGLIDEFRLLVHPVALGRGLPLFSGLAAPLDLSLVSTAAFAAGAVAHVYRPK